jgi:hypothetical protein
MPSLTGNTAIDVAIGLAFVYLLFSVLCSAVQEAIAGLLDMRAATLEAGLRNMLEDNGNSGTAGAPIPVRPIDYPQQDPDPAVKGAQPRALDPSNPSKKISLLDEILGHGLVRTTYTSSKLLFRRKRRGPSYLPSRTFALALLDIVTPSNGNDPIEKVRDSIEKSTLIPEGTKSTLLSLATGAIKDRDEYRLAIEHWFDSTMNRVSGWYKRKTQIIICVLSFGVAVGLNVNTVSIADRLINDDGLRAALVQSATNTAAKPGETVSKVAGQIQSLGLPIGWSKKPGDPARVSLSKHWGRAIGGWLITFLALSLGAPFWFDALGKIAGVRATGPPAKPANGTSGAS